MCDISKFTGAPALIGDEINSGWSEFYWTKMAAYFRDEKVAVVRRFMEEFKNKANLDIVDQLFAPDFVLHLPGKAIPPGPAGQKMVGKATFSAFSFCSSSIVVGVKQSTCITAAHRGHLS
ncbi:MAG TPA: hypothetical protein VEM40_12375 [Nitrospirota bacterium]|nr:hypothetical protein [Nitrospirota bacterium]